MSFSNDEFSIRLPKSSVDLAKDKNQGQINLAENLKVLLFERNIKARTLASRLQMNSSTLHNYLQGVVPKNLKSLIKLSDFFGVSLQDLVFTEQENRLAGEKLNGVEGKYEIHIKKYKNIRLFF